MVNPGKQNKKKVSPECLSPSSRRCEFLAKVLDMSPDGVLAADKKGAVLYISSVMFSMFGYKEKDFSTVKHWAELIIPDKKERTAVLATFRSGGASTKAAKIEIECKRKSGAMIWCHFQMSHMKDKGEDYFIVHVEDVTRQHESLETVRQAQFALDHIGDSVFWIRSDGRFIYVNSTACESLGYSQEELLKMKVVDIAPPITRKRWPAVWSRVKKNVAERFESTHITKDGQEFPVEILANYCEQGGVEYICGFARDISDRKQTDELLKKSEERFRSIVESSPMGMHMYEISGNNRLIFVGANPAADEILGVDNSKFVGKAIEDAFPPLKKTEVPKKYREVALKGENWETQQIEYKDSHIAGAYEVYAFQTAPGCMSAMFLDITDRKKAEEALRESEERYRLFVQHYHGIAFRTTTDLEPIFAHGAIESITGYSEEDFVSGKVKWRSIVHPDDKDEIKKHNKALTAKPGYSGSIEYKIINKDGDVRWVRERSQNVHDKKTKQTYCQGSIYDVTEKRKAESELRRLAAAVNGAAESIIITDSEGIIQYVNPWFERMTGYTVHEIVGKHSRVLGSGKHNREFYDEMWETIIKGDTWRGHFINRKKDGTFFEENAVISPVRNERGDVTSYVAVKRDVTEEKVLEDQVRQSQKMAAIGQLAHKVAHSFTNVLVIILGNAQLAKQESEASAKVCKFLDEVIKAGNRISTLTAELLAFAHPAPLSARPMGLNKLVSGIEEMLYRTIDPGIELSIKAKAKSGKVNVDPSQIEQVIVHMAINSVEAMPKGGKLVIETREAKSSEKDVILAQVGSGATRRSVVDYGVLSVTDTGCGMTEEIKARIFEPFFTDKRDTQNAGLGLSTAYSIIEQHDGFIVADSQPGKSSTFRIFLPIVSR